MHIYCWVCEGKNPDCDLCAGAGRMVERRCPNSVIQPEHWDAVRAFSMLEGGILPTGGGWLAIPVTGMHAIAIVGRERERLEELRRSRG